jgi:hypothetical protein
MFTNRKIQLFGIALLAVAAILVTLSAVKAPAPTLIPITGSNAEGLAIYQASERSANVANQKGQTIYSQSEHMLAFPVKSDSTLATSNAAGLAQYHRSEWGMFENVQEGLAIYHQSEWFGK